MTEEGMKKQKKRERHVRGLKGFIFGSALALGAVGIYNYKNSLVY